ncbi:hypothetical protein TNCV_3023931 [Trichonephila clavipes]|nr:hypothetical protein TNCV_3023931 [Trichonephila clavipes]
MGPGMTRRDYTDDNDGCDEEVWSSGVLLVTWMRLKIPFPIAFFEMKVNNQSRNAEFRDNIRNVLSSN